LTYEALNLLPLLAKRGEGGGEELCFIENDEPLTLTLSPLGRGEGNFRELHNPIIFHLYFVMNLINIPP
jgi:hypothetical protein